MKTSPQLARELQALQLLEDGGSTCGMHPKSIRRKLLSELLASTVNDELLLRMARDRLLAAEAREKAIRDAGTVSGGGDVSLWRRFGEALASGISPPTCGDLLKDIAGTVFGIDPGAPGGDKTAYVVAEVTDCMVAFAEPMPGPLTMEILVKVADDLASGKCRAGNRYYAHTSRAGTSTETPSPTTAPAAAREAVKEEATADSFQKVGELLQRFQTHAKADPKRLGDVDFARVSDREWHVEVRHGGQRRKMVVFASPEESLDGTIGYIVGAIATKFGDDYGDAIGHKLKAWQKDRGESRRVDSVGNSA